MRITINQIINKLLSLCICTIRPFLGPATCKFKETCTPYALRQLKEQPPHKAVASITKRLLQCSPLYRLF